MDVDCVVVDGGGTGVTSVLLYQTRKVRQRARWCASHVDTDTIQVYTLGAAGSTMIKIRTLGRDGLPQANPPSFRKQIGSDSNIRSLKGQDCIPFMKLWYSRIVSRSRKP